MTPRNPLCLFLSLALATAGTLSAQQPISYDFEGQDSEGWFPVEVPTVFEEVDLRAGDTALEIETSDNTNTFAYWNSPVTTVGEIQDKVVRATFRVSSDQENTATAPTVRMRANSEELDQAFLTVATSTGNGAFSPGFNTREYTLIYKPKGIRDNFSLAFDCLNFLADNDPTSTVRLESVDVELYQLLGTPRQELLLIFFNTDHGWTFETAEPVFGAPTHSVQSSGLHITGYANPDRDLFGYWQSPEGGPNSVIAEAGRFYLATFVVKSSTGDRQVVPTTRFRINTSSLQGGAVRAAESVGPLSFVPTPADSEGFAVYFVVPEELDGQEMTFSVDYIYSRASDDDPTVSIEFGGLSVTSLPFE